MSILEAMILGLVQGLSEFLPVSSSGHLVLAREMIGLTPTTEPAFEVFLHLGTLGAVFGLMFRDIRPLVCALPQIFQPNGWARAWAGNPGFRLLALVALGTLPVVIVGLLWRHEIEESFGKPGQAAALLNLTALFLIITRFLPARPGADVFTATCGRAVWVGVAQVVALLPGVSRSGTTMAAGLIVGLDRGTAGVFSFLLSIPAVFGAVLLTAKELSHLSLSPAVLASGFLASLASGWLALWLVLRMIRGGRLWYFAPYLVVVSAAYFLTRS